jgi:hypothetical protein
MWLDLWCNYLSVPLLTSTSVITVILW